VKVGGGLSYVTGPMGSGKSLFAVRHIVAYLTSARYVVTNVELMPDAMERIAHHIARTSGRAKRARIADNLRRYYVFERDLEEGMRYRPPRSTVEGRALFIWDESQNDLNNRSYRQRDDKFRNEATGGNALLEWATQLRKLGYAGYLLSQHHENTDAQLRRVCNYLVRLQNQREQVRLLGMRVTPWPLFLAYWYPSHTGLTHTRVQPVRVDRYLLSWHRHLYDTHGLYHGLAALPDRDWIELPHGGLPARASVPELPGGAVAGELPA